MWKRIADGLWERYGNELQSMTEEDVAAAAPGAAGGGGMRWFKRKQAEPPAPAQEQREWTPEELAQFEAARTWQYEIERRSYLTIDERMAEAEAYLNRGDVLMAYVLLTWHDWDLSEHRQYALVQGALGVIGLMLEHAELLKERQRRR